MAEKKIYEYFYIKVGFSNSLIEIFPQNEEENSYLWVGYEDWRSPILNSDGLIASKAIYEKNKKKNGIDLDRLYAASSSYNRKKTRLFGFSSKYLYLWEIIDDIKDANNNSIQVNEIKSNLGKKDEKYKTYIYKLFGQKNYKEFEKYPIENGRYVPVRCLKKIKREDLPPSVNTLAVYQYFSRGTFRKLSSIGYDRNEILNFLINEKKIKPMPIYNRDETKNEEETYYGLFFRLYFDSLFSNMNIEITDKLIWATLNPVQLEAFASLLCLEFGYTVDFFTANTVDAIDVIARKSSRCNENMQKQLINFLHFCGFSKVDKSILKLQCKAYFTTYNVDEEIILFTPMKDKDKINGKNSISIEEFFEWRNTKNNNTEFPLIDEWLLSLKRFYIKS